MEKVTESFERFTSRGRNYLIGLLQGVLLEPVEAENQLFTASAKFCHFLITTPGILNGAITVHDDILLFDYLPSVR